MRFQHAVSYGLSLALNFWFCSNVLSPKLQSPFCYAFKLYVFLIPGGGLGKEKIGLGDCRNTSSILKAHCWWDVQVRVRSKLIMCCCELRPRLNFGTVHCWGKCVYSDFVFFAMGFEFFRDLQTCQWLQHITLANFQIVFRKRLKIQHGKWSLRNELTKQSRLASQFMFSVLYLCCELRPQYANSV